MTAVGFVFGNDPVVEKVPVGGIVMEFIVGDEDGHAVRTALDEMEEVEALL